LRLNYECYHTDSFTIVMFVAVSGRKASGLLVNKNTLHYQSSEISFQTTRPM